MRIIRGLEEMVGLQTVRFPKSDEVRLAFHQYTKGWIVAMYHYPSNKWCYSYNPDRESALRYCEEHKALCEQFPNYLKKEDYSEAYVFSSNSTFRAKWSLNFMLVY